MALEAPYKGRDNAPAPADKAEDGTTDKPEYAGRDEDSAITATRHDAPQDEPVSEDVTGEEVAAEEEASPEVPDANLILMRADYSKKTKAVADRQREIDAREAAIAQREAAVEVYRQVDAILASNPELARTHTVEQLVTLIQSPTAPTQSAGLTPEVKKEIEEFRAERRELKEQAFAETVQAEMGRIKAEYGLNDEQMTKVVEIAVSAGELDYSTPRQNVHFKLDLIANKLASAAAVRKGQQKVVQQLKEKGRAAAAGNAAASTSAETAGPRLRGWEAITAKLIAERKAQTRG